MDSPRESISIPDRMRAAILYGKEDLRVEEIPSREPGRGEVRVAIGAALTCGTDLKVFKRGYHAKMIVPPSVFGHELAGTIIEVHPSVGSWQVGDRVVVANSAPCGECPPCRRQQENLCDDLQFLNGAYAEQIVVPERIVQRNMIRLKPETEFRDAALTEPFACVVQGINDLALIGSEHVLILGSGPIGLMFATLCRHLGCSVSVAGRGEQRLNVAYALGCGVIPIPDDTDPVGRVRGTSAEFDVVIEAVGKPELWEAAVQLVRKGGAVNFFGGCPGGSKIQLDTGLIHYSNLRLLASFHHTPRAIRQALGYIEKGVISAHTFVTNHCTLAELPSLFASMSRGNRAVKTLVDVSR